MDNNRDKAKLASREFGVQLSLNHLAEAGGQWLRQCHLKRRAQELVGCALLWLAVFPVPMLMAELVRYAWGQPSWNLSFHHYVSIALGLALLVTVIRWISQWFTLTISRTAALARYDRELSLSDRLVTAEEFSRRETRTPFMVAAIEDAGQLARAAQRHKLHETDPSPTLISPPAIVSIWLAIVLMLLSVWVGAQQQAPGIVVSGVSVDITGSSGSVDLRDQGQNSTNGSQLASEPAAGAGDMELAGNQDSPQQQANSSEGAGQQADLASQQSSEAEASSHGGAPKATAGSESGNGLASEGKGGLSKSASGNRSKKEKKENTNGEKSSAGASSSAHSATSNSDGGVGEGSNADSSVEMEEEGGDGVMVGSNRLEAEQKPEEIEVSDDDPQEFEEGGEGGEQGEEESQNGQAKTASGGKPDPNAESKRAKQESSESSSSESQVGKPADGRGEGEDPIKKERGAPSAILGVPMRDKLIGKSGIGPESMKQEQTQPSAESAVSLLAQSRMKRSNAMRALEPTAVETWSEPVVKNYFKSLRQTQEQKTESRKVER
ncbi:hypothetical protein QP938_02045 [Porticoccaceae bacterium LTM1]|nr:hypothetical protein QP938_02045 [Porticoccaceae bacterium LTM1]